MAGHGIGRWAAAALLALAARQAPAKAADPGLPPLIPVEDFAELPFMTRPVISPDGLHLVAGSAVKGKKSIVLADLSKDDYGLSRIVLPDDLEFIWARWAGNQRVVISLMVPGKIAGFEYRSSRLLLYDLATNKLTPFADKVGGFDGDNVIFVDPGGNYLLLSAQRSIFETPSVLRFDFATKATASASPRTRPTS